MRSTLLISGMSALMAVPLFSASCREAGAITHLLPDGYTGPVVIVFGDAHGRPPGREGDGGVVYVIPPDGVLRLSTPPPDPGWYDMRYYYVRSDGTRQEIASHVDERTLQIFAEVDGMAGGRGNENEDAILWRAYVVGVPDERDDWVKEREEATSRAISARGLP